MIRNDGASSYTTPTEWKMWNQTKLSQSQLERLTAERLVAESKRLQDDVGNRVSSTRREVSITEHSSQLQLLKSGNQVIFVVFQEVQFMKRYDMI